MKAFLLAAGLGTRLRPLTDTVPKPLVTIGGRTMLDIWLNILATAGVTDVLVNVHHLAHLIRAHVAQRQEQQAQPMVHLVEETQLLGSAGTLRANRDFVAGEEMFLVINADNLTDFDLIPLIETHRTGGAIATLSLFRAPDPTACGIVEVQMGRVVGFEEKPAHPRGDLANAGMYAFSPGVLNLIEGPAPVDIGYHLLPQLVGKSTAVTIGDSYFIDIGSPLALAAGQAEWNHRYPS